MKSPTRQGSYLRGGVWLLHIGLPLLGLWVLLARPEVDAHVQHNPTHFWLVAGVALINVAIASRISAEAACVETVVAEPKSRAPSLTSP